MQPRLTAIAGVQKADILGGRTFAMREFDSWNEWPRSMSAHLMSSGAFAKQLSRRDWEHKRFAPPGQPDRKHRFAYRRPQFNSWWSARPTAHSGIGDIKHVVLGAEDYNSEVRFTGKAVFMGIFVLPNANSVDDQACSS